MHSAGGILGSARLRDPSPYKQRAHTQKNLDHDVAMSKERIDIIFCHVCKNKVNMKFDMFL